MLSPFPVKPYKKMAMSSNIEIIGPARLFDGRRPLAGDSLAHAGGRILATGRLRALTDAFPQARRRETPSGAWLLPGFFDAHLHPLWLGLSLARPSLAACRTPADIAAALAAADAPGPWLIAGGLDESRLDPPALPDRTMLDRIAPDRPLLLLRVCEHAGVANSAALAAAGIAADAPDPPGGRYGRDPGGRLDGRLYETALWRLESGLPKPDRARKAEALRLAGRHLRARGITGVVEAAAGMLDGMADLAAYRAACESGDLPQRCALIALAAPDGVDVDSLKRESGDRLWLSGLKYFVDGTIGARTAALARPYRDGGDGALTLDPAWLKAEVALRHAAGWPLAFHAIGDRAVASVLDALESAAAVPRAGPPHRLEHAMMLDADSLARMRRLGVAPVPQPLFLHEFGPMYEAALGPRRTAGLIPLAAMRRAGLDPAASSDAPIAPAEPLASLRAMLTRRDTSGASRGPGQRLPLFAALAALTAAGPASLGRGRDFGRLAPGFPADLVLIAGHPADPNARIALTMIAGEATIF